MLPRSVHASWAFLLPLLNAKIWAGSVSTGAVFRQRHCCGQQEVHHLISNAGDFGLSVGDVSFDLGKVIKRSRDVADRLSGGVSHLMKKNGITVMMASARLGQRSADGREVILDNGDVVTGKSIILATGARARNLPGIEADGEKIVTYRDAMTPQTMPQSLIVVGSGAIGIEFASFYRDMGVDGDGTRGCRSHSPC